ncbi:MAG: Ig domain-containing protein [Nitrospirota bacterium]
MSLIHFHLNSLKFLRKFIIHSFRIILLALVYASGLTACGDTSNVSAPPAGPGPLSIATQSHLPSGTINQPYAAVVGGSGGTTPYTWSLASGSPALPAGLSLNTTTGVIVGTPTILVTTTPIFRLQDASSPLGVVEKSLTIAILTTPQALSMTTASLPNGVVNQPYPITTLVATGGLQPYSWSVNPALPNGLQLNVVSSGTISGTPLPGADGTTNHTFTVTDSMSPFNQTDNQQLSLTINLTVPPLTITFPAGNTLPNGRVDQLYSQTLLASGGTHPYTWSVAPDLPAWLQLDESTGSLTGSPTITSNFSRIYTVRDSTLPTNLTVSRSISLRIRS